ncbi:MAG: nucleotide exchange factor GrpE [Candidatus Diapherotrites archaeon]|nr:nucleotide exchange factor GrpE [Candidatus Diapherotrites archaeon]
MIKKFEQVGGVKTPSKPGSQEPQKDMGSVQRQLEELRNKLAAQETKTQEYVETLQRLQAEFENAQKRMEKEKGELKQFAVGELMKELLAFADALEDALKHASTPDQKGLKALHAQFMHVLQHNGIQPLQTIGKAFNPEVHECMLKGEDASKDDGIVVEEFQKGYLFHGRVLRPAKVKVNVHKQQEQSRETQSQEVRHD